MRTQTAIAFALISLLSACDQGPKPELAKDKATPASLLLANEDLVEISSERVASGPVISGSLQAQKQADLRAEVSAIVIQVLKDNGDRVQKGDLLVRLDDTTFRQALSSAEEAERAAHQSFDQAERQFNRLKTLSSTGAVSAQAQEDAEVRRNNAQSELAAARTRVVQERRQLERTEVRAPFAGIVGAREVSNGDTAQTGKALLKVIDPSSIRFEGFVPTEQVNQIKAGQIVNFRVNGFNNQPFDGRIERINPVVDLATRQVGVQVALSNTNNLVVGLFAEGRVQTNVKQGLTIPESSLVQQGDHHYVWRVQKGVLNKVEIKLGQRDVQSGDFAVVTGLIEGDQIIRHPRGALVDGASVNMERMTVAAGQ